MRGNQAIIIIIRLLKQHDWQKKYGRHPHCPNEGWGQQAHKEGIQICSWDREEPPIHPAPLPDPRFLHRWSHPFHQSLLRYLTQIGSNWRARASWPSLRSSSYAKWSVRALLNTYIEYDPLFEPCKLTFFWLLYPILLFCSSIWIEFCATSLPPWALKSASLGP